MHTHKLVMLAPAFLSGLTVCGTAFAGIVSTSPSSYHVTDIPSIVSVEFGESVTGAEYIAFDEKQCFPLSFPLFISSGNSIPAGTVVSCHLVHRQADLSFYGYLPPVTKVTVELDEPVIGVIQETTYVAWSDAHCALTTDIDYPDLTDSNNRGLDWSPNTGDAVAMTSSYVVEVDSDGVTERFAPVDGFDQVRIITECE